MIEREREKERERERDSERASERERGREGRRGISVHVCMHMYTFIKIYSPKPSAHIAPK